MLTAQQPTADMDFAHQIMFFDPFMIGIPYYDYFSTRKVSSIALQDGSGKLCIFCQNYLGIINRNFRLTSSPPTPIPGPEVLELGIGARVSW